MALYFCSVKAERRHIHLLLALVLILSPALMVCSRPLLNHYSDHDEDEGVGMVEGSMMLGSRPPLCEGICDACGRCEAVQVPAIPQKRNIAAGNLSDLMNRRGDYSSNYKPLSWKCKCGDVILNP